jgi:hypothetical protein
MAIEVGIDLTKLCILFTLIDYGFDVGVEDVVSNKQTNKQTADCFAASYMQQILVSQRVSADTYI